MDVVKLIKDDKSYREVLSRIDEIFDAEPNTPEGDELDLLVTLVELYEKQKYIIEAPEPISAIRFRMEQLNLKNKDLVQYIGSKSKVSEVLSGKRPLSLNMIRKLHEELGIPAEVLIKDSKSSLPDSSVMEHGKNYPFSEMFKRGWFSDFFSGSLNEAKESKEELLVRFIGPFQIDDFDICYNRKSSTEKDACIDDLLLAWRIRVMNRAIKEKLPEWNSDVLSDSFFSELVRLSYLAEGPKLAMEFLNKAGIHLIIEKHLPRTHLDGSSMLLPDRSPVVALTLRYDRLDSFWFTLFHELAHIKKHLNGERTAYFDDMTDDMDKRIEREADVFAKQKLIPDKIWQASGLSVFSSPSEINAFAYKNRISPSIPAGRLRFENKNYKVFANLIGSGEVRRLFE